ncbi:MAG: ImmA/IrrE family metallo-endopeptidase [Clostridia bacterium]|nr:ImmA/IrrE family metallo-endopeptidase [Clostridia bacterium]
MSGKLYGKTAEEILSMCGQIEAVPVDVKTILEKLEISALPYDFSDVEENLPSRYKGLSILGAMISSKENSAILYNAKDKRDSHRTRFTIAHEIAHACLHGSNHHIEFRIDGDLDEHEIAANTFAGELLIPEKTLRSIIKQLLVPTVASLADIFDVSINVMRERINHLNLEDQVVIA